MDQLVPLINRLQDVFNTVGGEQIQLPQIVAIGSQSSGKSSVLENLVNHDFLPRGAGIVTRCPLVLQLVHVDPSDNQIRDVEGNGTVNMWAKFLHKKNQTFTDFNDVRREIEKETNRVAGNGKTISNEAIHLQIYSPDVLNITLVDLPGITKIPVGDQPEDIESQVNQLCLHYISNPNSVILAVTPANADMANSEAIKLAKQVDPDGERTLCVLTKLDLMDKGTDAQDLLMNRVIHVRLGIIGVVNRSQADINNNKSIAEALRDETSFLQRRYISLASRNGTAYLGRTLNGILTRHIRDRLPDLKLRINVMAAQFQALLNSSGEEVEDKGQILLQLITRFNTAYCTTVDGVCKVIETEELRGGARIYHIFHDTLHRTLNRLDPLEGLSSLQILTAIRNATGPRPPVFTPEVAFRLLVKRQISRLEQPSLQCVDLVHEEMQCIIHHCGTQQEIMRFPNLHKHIVGVVTSLLRRCLVPTMQMVSNLIALELAYINTEHPDFNAAIARQFGHIPSISNFALSLGFNTCQPTGEDAGADGKPEAPRKYHKRYPHTRTSNKFTTLPSATDSSLEASSDLYSEFQGNSVSEAERNGCYLISKLIRAYFDVVRMNIQDSVPKAIMHFLVNYTKDHLQSELVSKLYRREEYDSLLQENELMAERRKNATDMLKALLKAGQVVNAIREGGTW